MITLITCTGHRPEAFALCIQYMVSQTYKEPLQWIVVTDDGKGGDLVPLFKLLPKNITPELYNAQENWRPGVNTHKFNMEQALDKIKGDRILFIEDDDYYHPRYIETMNTLLDVADIAGEANASYYNIKIPGWRRMQNYNQASLAQTGIKVALLPALKAAMKMDGNIDGNLWELTHKQGVKGLLVTDYNLCIGMKGLPGRPGIGIGHSFKDYLPDPNLSILRKWLGDSALPYIELMKKIIGGQKNEISNAKQKDNSLQTGNQTQAQNGRTAKGESASSQTKTQNGRTAKLSTTLLSKGSEKIRESKGKVHIPKAGEKASQKTIKATEIADGVSKG